MIVQFNTKAEAEQALSKVNRIGAILFTLKGEHIECNGNHLSDVSKYELDSSYNLTYDGNAVDQPVLIGKNVKTGVLDRRYPATTFANIQESAEGTFYFTSPRGFMNAANVTLPNGKSVSAALDEILPNDEAMPEDWMQGERV